jgi:hypothetical protein
LVRRTAAAAAEARQSPGTAGLAAAEAPHAVAWAPRGRAAEVEARRQPRPTRRAKRSRRRRRPTSRTACASCSCPEVVRACGARRPGRSSAWPGPVRPRRTADTAAGGRMTGGVPDTARTAAPPWTPRATTPPAGFRFHSCAACVFVSVLSLLLSVVPLARVGVGHCLRVEVEKRSTKDIARQKNAIF